MSKTLTLFTVAAILFGSASTFAATAAAPAPVDPALLAKAKAFITDKKNKFPSDYLKPNGQYDEETCSQKKFTVMQTKDDVCKWARRDFDKVKNDFIIQHCPDETKCYNNLGYPGGVRDKEAVCQAVQTCRQGPAAAYNEAIVEVYKLKK